MLANNEGQFYSLKYTTQVKEKTCLHITGSKLNNIEQSLASSMDPNKPV